MRRNCLTLYDIEVAIRQKHGESHFLTHSRPRHVGRVWPNGTRCWWVEHESSTCPHTPPCHWFGYVYWCHGYFTVLDGITDLPFLSLRETIDRVSRATHN